MKPIVGIIVALAITLSFFHFCGSCHIPAIFNFGDSNSDTGSSSAAFPQPPLPYGITFFGKPSGRASDGRLIIDFLAEKLGLPYLSAYLDSIGSNFGHGVNFAVSGATIQQCNGNMYDADYNPLSLDIQLFQFEELKARTAEFYEQGARAFWIHNTGPIGCLPLFAVLFPAKPKETDKNGCVKAYNEFAQEFNRKLKERVYKLRGSLQNSTITYVDIYSAKYDLINNAAHYGFRNPLGRCFGNTTLTANGTIVYDLCSNPSQYISWDGAHYTEAANKWVAHRIANGFYSHPQIPITEACHKSYHSHTVGV